MNIKQWLMAGAVVLAVGFSPAALAQSGVKLRVGDVIDVRISGVPAEEVAQFNAVYTVDNEGMINVPYLGLVKAQGLDAGALQTSLQNRLVSERIYTHPTIMVNIPQAVRLVNVGGNVRAPQRIAYTPDMTLMTAINAVGGFNEFANRKRVRLVREGKTATYNTDEIKKDPRLDPPVKPGDQIDVPAAGLLPFFD